MQPVDGLASAIDEASRGETKQACVRIFQGNPQLMDGQKIKIHEIIKGWWEGTQGLLLERREDLKEKLLKAITEPNEPSISAKEVVPTTTIWKFVVRHLNLPTLFCMNQVSKGLAKEVKNYFLKGISPQRFAKYLRIPFYDTKQLFPDKPRGRPQLMESSTKSHETHLLVEKPMKNLQWVIKKRSSVEGRGKRWVLLFVRGGINDKTVIDYIRKNHPEIQLMSGDYAVESPLSSPRSYLGIFSSNIFLGTRSQTAEQQDQLLAQNGCRKLNRLEFIILSSWSKIKKREMYGQYDTRLQKCETSDTWMGRRTSCSEIGSNGPEMIRIHVELDEAFSNLGAGGAKLLSYERSQSKSPRASQRSKRSIS
jgi:hypothetical protein